MAEYIRKGEPYPTELYNFEIQDPDIASWGLAGRAQTWDLARRRARVLLADPPEPGLRLKIWKNTRLVDWQWCLRWVPKEEP